VQGSLLEKPTLDELSRFDSKTYVKLIRYLSQTYRIVPCCEIPEEKVPYLILRHDVDVSLLSALKMAEIEHGIGVRSTYFVLFSSKHYNSFEGKNASAIRQILALGHEIGLHYDVDQYASYDTDAVHALRSEVEALQSISGKPVRSISCHAPRDPNSILNVRGYVNADDPHLRDIYVHDSKGLWTVKSLAVMLNNPPQKVQLLVHPCHWGSSVKGKTNLDLMFSRMLLLLYRVRTIGVRVFHSRESCEN
jgi:hypothetical protein